MSGCAHEFLELLPVPDRVRCVHCHLTITVQELNGEYCPECFEESGVKRYEFEVLGEPRPDRVRYRCESCGVIIES